METTKTKQQLLKDYFLQSIDFDSGYGLENTIENVYNTCLNEYGHIKNDYQRIHERVLGLPSCLNIEYSYWNIQQLMYSFGYTTENIYRCSDMYWHKLTMVILAGKK